jgi:glycosyltransferase involved in cell wall biosynthesis
MKPKSILLIMPYGSVGGMERLALNFYKFYKKQGYTVKGLKFIKLDSDIICFGEDELFFKSKDFSSMTLIDRYGFYLKLPLLIRKIIKTHNITHSIAFGDMANFFSSLTYTKEVKIGSIHALKSVELKNKTFFNKLTQFGYKTTYKNLTRLVCISKAIKNDLIKECGYRFSNLEVIYNPHNVTEIIELSNAPILDQNEQIIFSNQTILFLGRLSIQKAPWHFIKAFSIVLKSHPSLNLVIIGDGDNKVIKHIKELISELNLDSNVFLLGRRSNPYKYIAAADLLVLSSNYEGTPNVIVESIAIGTPIVSSYCTKGIMELMSLEERDESNLNIETISGIVTPNFFEGKLEIPTNNMITNKEKQFSKALAIVLNDKNFKENLNNNKSNLLAKFDLKTVAINYLS